MNTSSHSKNSQFVAVLNAAIEHHRVCKRFGQAHKIEAARNSFSRFLALRLRPHLRVEELDSRLLQDYQDWLLGQSVTKNSSSCYMRTLQSIYRQAVDFVPGEQENPFARVYRGVAKTAKRAAAIESLRAILRVDIRQGLVNLGKNPRHKTFKTMQHKLEFTRDLFIFSYCARGMSFVDMVYLRKSDVNHGFITYARRKTGQWMNAKLVPIMASIVLRYAPEAARSLYLFPILRATDEAEAYREYRSALRTYNGYLKLLAKMLGNGVVLTSYVARHSWASHMYQENAPLSVISQGLGHDSEATTLIYIKSLETNVINKINEEFLNRVLLSPLFGEKDEK